MISEIKHSNRWCLVFGGLDTVKRGRKAKEPKRVVRMGRMKNEEFGS